MRKKGHPAAKTLIPVLDFTVVGNHGDTNYHISLAFNSLILNRKITLYIFNYIRYIKVKIEVSRVFTMSEVKGTRVSVIPMLRAKLSTSF